eukprot:836048-Prymnesium_polylepis.1
MSVFIRTHSASERRSSSSLRAFARVDGMAFLNKPRCLAVHLDRFAGSTAAAWKSSYTLAV